MKQIPLTKGLFALVDDIDFEWLNQWKWYFDPDGYALRTIWKIDHYERIRMHRLIMNTPKGMETDHINLNRLDNRKCNLRICTRAQNAANRLAQRNSSSGIKGVRKRKDCNTWESSIQFNRKSIHIGDFDSEKQATEAYYKKAIELYGEFARGD